MSLQIPSVGDRAHFVRVKVIVHEYEDGSMEVFHKGKCRLGVYDKEGTLVEEAEEARRVASG